MAFKFTKVIKGILLNKTFDLLIVIVGVSIAFQLNNLKQQSDQQSLEDFYLESLSTDVEKDIEKMKEILGELKSDQVSADECLQKTIEPAKLEPTLMQILTFETFNDRNENTYKTLINAGGLTIISNRKLRGSLIEYYQSYRSIDRFESVYTEFLLNHFNTHFSPHYDYSSQKLIDLTLLKDAQTKNNLLIAKSQLGEGIEGYENALTKALALSKLLNARL